MTATRPPTIVDVLSRQNALRADLISKIDGLKIELLLRFSLMCKQLQRIEEQLAGTPEIGRGSPYLVEPEPEPERRELTPEEIEAVINEVEQDPSLSLGGALEFVLSKVPGISEKSVGFYRQTVDRHPSRLSPGQLNYRIDLNRRLLRHRKMW